MATKIAFIALADLLNDAGFPGGTSQLDGIATVCSESGRDPAAKNVNTDGSIDRGLWQINDKAHPDVTDAEAYDPAQATAAAFDISHGGTNYAAWVGFTSGAYEKHLEAAAVALDGAAKIRTLTTSNTALKSQVGGLQTQLAAAQAQLADTEAKLTAAQSSLASEVTALNVADGKIAAAQKALS